MKQNEYNMDPTQVFDAKELDIDDEGYDSANDPDVTDTYGEELIRWRDKLMSYQRYIMIVGFTILIILVVFLGYARGALDVCNDLGGRLEINWMMPKCHPDYYKQNIDSVEQSIIIQNIGLGD